MNWESSAMVGFDLEPLLQSQMSIDKLIGPRDLGW